MLFQIDLENQLFILGHFLHFSAEQEETGTITTDPQMALTNIHHLILQYAACKVKFQPFKRLYSQLTFFNFLQKKKNFDVEDTCRTYFRTFVHIQSIGRYDPIGATCHRESDKKCTVGDFVSSIVLGHLSRAEAESHRLSSAPRPLISSTLFLLVTYH